MKTFFSSYFPQIASSLAPRLVAAVFTASIFAAHAICPANLGPSPTPTADFTLNAEGTVTHTKTGLMWKRCEEGRSGPTCETGTSTTFTWAAALVAAKDSTFAGRSDWRVPSKQELESIVDETCFFPAINSAVFPNIVNSFLWTSTTYHGDPANAWNVMFIGGDSGVFIKASGLSGVRLVRGGQFDALVALPTPVPTLGAWTMALLSMLLLIGARFGNARRRG
jgi:Protein of unknown function (DUF1566)/IPTL-CTERM motif